MPAEHQPCQVVCEQAFAQLCYHYQADLRQHGSEDQFQAWSVGFSPEQRTSEIPRTLVWTVLHSQGSHPGNIHS